MARLSNLLALFATVSTLNAMPAMPIENYPSITTTEAALAASSFPTSSLSLATGAITPTPFLPYPTHSGQGPLPTASAGVRWPTLNGTNFNKGLYHHHHHHNGTWNGNNSPPILPKRANDLKVRGEHKGQPPADISAAATATGTASGHSMPLMTGGAIPPRNGTENCDDGKKFMGFRGGRVRQSATRPSHLGVAPTAVAGST